MADLLALLEHKLGDLVLLASFFVLGFAAGYWRGGKALR